MSSFYNVELKVICLLNPLPWHRRDDKHYASDKEVKSVLMKWIKEESTEFYKAEVYALIRRRDIATERNGDYF